MFQVFLSVYVLKLFPSICTFSCKESILSSSKVSFVCLHVWSEAEKSVLLFAIEISCLKEVFYFCLLVRYSRPVQTKDTSFLGFGILFTDIL